MRIGFVKNLIMNYAIKMLLERLNKLDRMYDEYVINGNVRKNSWSAKNNRAEAEDLRKAIKILTD